MIPRIMNCVQLWLGASATKSPSSQLAATPRRWLLSVVTLCRRARTGSIPFIRISRPIRRSPKTRPAFLSDPISLWRHPRSAIAAKSQRILLTDVHQHGHVSAATLTDQLVDNLIPTCPASTCQHPNPTQHARGATHWSVQSGLLPA